MNLGVVISVYNGIEFLEECLKDWILLRSKLRIKIAIVDCLFESFSGDSPNSNDGTVELLEEYLHDGKIDFFQKLQPNLKENEARNVGIEYLLKQEVSHVLTTAPDEIFKASDIEKLFTYLENENDSVLYYLNYKNYIGNKNTYVLGFCPKRIWKVQFYNLFFNGLRFDDDGTFFDAYTNRLIKDDILPSSIIPDLQISHYSWLDGEASRKKIEYQKSRGWVCSYKTDENNKVLLNEEFYQNNLNVKIPAIYNDQP